MLTLQQLKKIANLSKLKLSEEKAEKYNHQINEILNFVDMLKEVDVSGIEEVSMIEAATLRDDEPKPSLTQAEALSGCDNTLKGGFKVPSVLGKAT